MATNEGTALPSSVVDNTQEVVSVERHSISVQRVLVGKNQQSAERQPQSGSGSSGDSWKIRKGSKQIELERVVRPRGRARLEAEMLTRRAASVGQIVQHDWIRRIDVSPMKQICVNVDWMDRDTAGCEQEHHEEMSDESCNHRAGGRRDNRCWEDF